MRKLDVKTYIGLLGVLALLLASSWIHWYGVPFNVKFVLTAAVFGTAFFLLTAFPIKVTERSEIEATDVIQVVSVVLLGPFWATLASLPSALYVGRKDFLRSGYEAARNTIELHAAGMVFSLASGPLLLQENVQTGNVAVIVYATLAASVVLVCVNSLDSALLMKIKYGQSFGETWRGTFEPYLLAAATNVLTAGLAVLALLLYGPVAAIVVVAGAILSQVMVHLSKDRVIENRELKARVASLEESLDVANLTFGAMMIEDLGRKDGYTHLHAAATATYAADIARELDFDVTAVKRLRMAGFLHNIGMFGAPTELLVATGTLNSIAKARIYEHPVLGEKALSSVPEFAEIAKWVRWHHERPDGRGYPDRLRAAWIPLEARVLAVAQAYAAMVLDQPRRPGLDPAAARRELNAGAGSRFDEVVVRAFLRILDTESEGYRSADDGRFGFNVPGGDRNLPGSRDLPDTPAGTSR
ncbi:HD domain [Rubrobacter radiotolerans]|uniref:HD domain n=1 Tax=Rubrobacter radiotolerans TaxID=42256 RepID=A0A023X1A0_RUBRA|nr:HD domain [Rubrobacter radiotolerans]SMC04224.1 HD domain-containing protein [Rubrobacter radiotolerans DSM 5868]